MKRLLILLFVLFGLSPALLAAQEFEFLGVNSEMAEGYEVARVKAMAYSWDGRKFAVSVGMAKNHFTYVYTSAGRSVLLTKYSIDHLVFTKKDILIVMSGSRIEYFYPTDDGKYESGLLDVDEHTRYMNMYVDSARDELLTLIWAKIRIQPIVDRQKQVGVEPLEWIDLNKEKRKGLGLVGLSGISPDGRWLVCGTTSNEIIIVDIPKREVVWRGSKRHDSTLWDADFTPDCRWLATLGAEGVVLLWDTQKDDLLRNRPSDRLKLRYEGADMIFANNHSLVIVGGLKETPSQERSLRAGKINRIENAGRATVWNIESGVHKPLEFPTADWKQSRCVVRNPANGIVAVGTTDGRVFFFRPTPTSREQLVGASAHKSR